MDDIAVKYNYLFGSRLLVILFDFRRAILRTEAARLELLVFEVIKNMLQTL
jgi:hypothetical protein